MTTVQHLLRGQHVGSIDEAINVFKRYPATEELQAFFLKPELQGLPIELVLERAETHLIHASHIRLDRIYAEIRDKPLALALPVPPHVFSLFTHLPDLWLLAPLAVPIPRELNWLSSQTIRDGRICRQRIREMALIVAEAAADVSAFWCEPEVLELLELAPPDAILAVHVAPYRHSHFEAVGADIARRFELL